MSVSEPKFIKRLEDEEKNRQGDSKALTHDLALLTGNLKEGNGAIDRTFNEIFENFEGIKKLGLESAFTHSEKLSPYFKGAISKFNKEI